MQGISPRAEFESGVLFIAIDIPPLQGFPRDHDAYSPGRVMSSFNTIRKGTTSWVNILDLSSPF